MNTMQSARIDHGAATVEWTESLCLAPVLREITI